MNQQLWQPSKLFSDSSQMQNFVNFVNANTKENLASYDQLWNWSVNHIATFWEMLWKFFNIEYSGNYKSVLHENVEMIGSKWFEGAKLSYAEHIFRNKNENDTALYFENELGHNCSYSWKELKNETSRIAQFYLEQGIQPGDRIAAFLPNIPETLIAFLACNAVGAVWSSCSPDFGSKSVIDRFQQIEPKILLLSNAYSYNGKIFDKTEQNNELIAELKSVKKVISISYIKSSPDFVAANSVFWQNIPNTSAELKFQRQEFNEPIWILYSSGTTGVPKAITHSVGGILLEHYKALGLHQNVGPDDVFFWYSTTGWMMWNYANSALLLGAKLVLFEGSTSYPNLEALWNLALKQNITHFGAGAAFYIACMKENGRVPNLPALKSIGSTGSPLPAEAFRWIYQEVKQNLWLVSLSGGTDICSAFVGGNPYSPVHEGEIQCRMLGVNLHAYNEEENKVINELGELVIDSPLPSMPIYFWNDPSNERYRESYFKHYPGKWRHGDWIKINSHGGIEIFGRSDSTLNRGGVRIGTSEVYSAVESVPEVKDSLVLCIDYENGKQYMPLFVVLKDGAKLSPELIQTIKTQLKTQYSPRHIPDEIIQIKEVPYTISGKKMEAPIKKILMGIPLEKSASKDAMKNPNSISFFEDFAKIKLR